MTEANKETGYYQDWLAWLAGLEEETFRVLTRLTSGRHWAWKATLVTVAASLFFAFPSLDSLDASLQTTRAGHVAHQIESLPEFWSSNPTTNVVFRITMPVVAGLLGLDLRGALALQFIAGILLLYLLVRIGERTTGDRVSGLLFSLMVGFTWAGSSAFVELRSMYDGVAFCLLAAAMWFRSPIVIAGCAFLASFTDERAFVATGFLVLWWAVDRCSFDELSVRTVANRRSVAAICGGVAYAIARILVARSYGLQTMIERRHLFSLPDQINIIPFGVWTGLEAGWVIVVIAFVVIWLHRKYGFFAVTGGLVLLLALLAVSVVDVTRSMAYELPALVVALGVLAKDKPTGIRRLLLITAAVSLFAFTYYAGGKSTVWWQYPLPLQALRWLSGAG